MRKILLVEDNTEIMSINATALKMRGYEVITAETLQKADHLLVMHDPDMIVLDIMLPDGNGIEWCKRNRPSRSIPILFLSALGESDDIVAGLQAGGDDYLAKPYDLNVLIARIEVRIKAAEQSERYLSMGEMLLDSYSGAIACGGEELSLTQKEFAVLQLLIRYSRRGKGIAKEELYRTVWQQSIENDGNALWSVISRLKSKSSACHSGLTISHTKADGYQLTRE